MVLEPEDASDILRDSVEEDGGGGDHADVDRFRRRAALLVGTLAACLAITALGGSNATKDVIDANIQASDTFAFYQAKNIRQTNNLLAADQLEALLAINNPPEATKVALQKKVDQYRATAARYESEPETGEGKKELLQKANAYVANRDKAQEKDPNFDYSQAFLQIAIVLGSVAIVAVSKPVLALSSILGTLAIVLMLNGFFLWFSLPI
jgi:hypothetical protein